MHRRPTTQDDLLVNVASTKDPVLLDRKLEAIDLPHAAHGMLLSSVMELHVLYSTCKYVSIQAKTKLKVKGQGNNMYILYTHNNSCITDTRPPQKSVSQKLVMKMEP